MYAQKAEARPAYAPRSTRSSAGSPGTSAAGLQQQIASGCDIETFFADAPRCTRTACSLKASCAAFASKRLRTR